MRPFARLALLAALVPITGCSNGDGDQSPANGDPNNPETGTATSQAALVSLRSCSEVDEAVRAAAIRAMGTLIDEQKDAALAALADGNCWWYSGGLDEDDMVYSAAGDGAAEGGSNSPSEVSETNNQVAGVDEADFIKNDADGFIYVLADNALQIIDGWPAAESQLISRTELPDTPRKLFVLEDTVLIYSSVARTNEETADYDSWWWNTNSEECTYGYDCDFTGDGNKTRLTIYDVSNRATPKLVRTIDTSATFISARRVGSAVHTVLYEEPELLRTLPIVPQAISDKGLCSDMDESTRSEVAAPNDPERVGALFDALKADNLEAIAAAPLDKLMGTVEDRVADGATRERDLGTCAGFYDSPLADGTAYLTLMSLDLGDTEPAQTSTIISRPGASYATGEAYYVSVRQNPYAGNWYADAGEAEEVSTVHKFDLAGASSQYAASGLVEGRVLNQFSMDEYDGHLRIATTTGYVPDPSVHSTLSVLAQNGAALDVVGKVGDIAPTEDIRSVRFVEDQAYVVTFKKTDPLWVFDLSDPKNPQIQGELHIPGYSTYMHPLDETHLLTIGFDAQDEGDFAWYQGLMLQIFDVSDPENPTLAHKVVIGTRGSTSEAATDHLAFNYFPSQKVLALPVTVCENSSGGSDYGQMTFSGVQFYDIDIDEGITLRGAVDHPYVDPYDSESYYVGGECSTWWSDSTSVVKRTVFMENYVYSVSDRLIKVNDLEALSPDVAQISLDQP